METALLPTVLPAAPLASGRLLAPASRSTVATRDAGLDPKLVSAAHQFEASLMEELLRPLSSGQIFGDDQQGENEGGLGTLTSGADGSGGALLSFGSEALAKALSEGGGLGIAREVLDHFEAVASEALKQPGQAGRPRPKRAGEDSLGQHSLLK